MLKRKRVKVTQKHIDTGHRGNGHACAIALALVDEGFTSPMVGRQVGAFLDGEVVNLQVVDKIAFELFISRYDSGQTVAPFALEFLYEETQKEHAERIREERAARREAAALQRLAAWRAEQEPPEPAPDPQPEPPAPEPVPTPDDRVLVPA